MAMIPATSIILSNLSLRFIFVSFRLGILQLQLEGSNCLWGGLCRGNWFPMTGRLAVVLPVVHHLQDGVLNVEQIFQNEQNYANRDKDQIATVGVVAHGRHLLSIGPFSFTRGRALAIKKPSCTETRRWHSSFSFRIPRPFPCIFYRFISMAGQRLLCCRNPLPALPFIKEFTW